MYLKPLMHRQMHLTYSHMLQETITDSSQRTIRLIFLMSRLSHYLRKQLILIHSASQTSEQLRLRNASQCRSLRSCCQL